MIQNEPSHQSIDDYLENIKPYRMKLRYKKWQSFTRDLIDRCQELEDDGIPKAVRIKKTLQQRGLFSDKKDVDKYGNLICQIACLGCLLKQKYENGLDRENINYILKRIKDTRVPYDTTTWERIGTNLEERLKRKKNISAGKLAIAIYENDALFLLHFDRYRTRLAGDVSKKKDSSKKKKLKKHRYGTW